MMNSSDIILVIDKSLVGNAMVSLVFAYSKFDASKWRDHVAPPAPNISSFGLSPLSLVAA